MAMAIVYGFDGPLVRITLASGNTYEGRLSSVDIVRSRLCLLNVVTEHLSCSIFDTTNIKAIELKSNTCAPLEIITFPIRMRKLMMHPAIGPPPEVVEPNPAEAEVVEPNPAEAEVVQISRKKQKKLDKAEIKMRKEASTAAGKAVGQRRRDSISAMGLNVDEKKQEDSKRYLMGREY